MLYRSTTSTTILVKPAIRRSSVFDSVFSSLPWFAWVVLFAGFVPLIFGADRLVEGGAAIAKLLGIPPLVIGLTVVAFGTSAPELVVTLFSASGGSTDLALGNILGSNILNILLILGVTTLISPLVVQPSTAKIEVPIALLAALMILLLANDSIIEGAAVSQISRIDGIILVVFFIFFLIYNFNLIRIGQTSEVLEVKPFGMGLALFWLIFGLALLVLGGKMIVDGAVFTARRFGIDERVIGVTVVALGTSLPELATSVVAALKKNTDIAVGNIVGSNIFNVFLVLGLAATVSPVQLNGQANFDVLFHVGAAAMLLFFIFVPTKLRLSRWQGGIFFLGYAAYMVSTITVR